MENNKNLMDKIELQRKNMNPRYDAGYYDIEYIAKNSTSPEMYGIHCFTYGYMQGYKAAMAELKKTAGEAGGEPEKRL